MSVVPAGSNLIGSPAHESGRSANEGPQQPVAFRVAFAVGRSEIAFEEYIACVNEGGCPAGLPNDYGWGYGKQPAMNVSWNDAKAYVAWLSRKTGGKYRLLSEAEWEYCGPWLRQGVRNRCVLVRHRDFPGQGELRLARRLSRQPQGVQTGAHGPD